MSFSEAEPLSSRRGLPLPQRPDDLPDYENPPLAEVALGVQLDPMPQVRAAHLGLLWQSFYSDFPSLQEVPPLETPEESFGADQIRTITVQILGPQTVPRHWFTSRDQTRVIQVQSDRFILNWRRTPKQDAYPRYEQLRLEFERYYLIYLDFLEDHKLGVPTVRQAEVNYINQIPLEPSGQPKDLSDVLRIWRPTYGREAPFLAVADEIRLVERHVISGNAGPFARLYISAEPGIATQALVTLTMRGRPSGTDLPGALQFFDEARNHIVRAFTAVTTELMHRRWRRVK